MPKLIRCSTQRVNLTAFTQVFICDDTNTGCQLAVKVIRIKKGMDIETVS